ncbi:MAG: ATP-binding protein, partial [Desulfofustis sp.]
PIEELLDKNVIDWLKGHENKKIHHGEMSFPSKDGSEKRLRFTKRHIDDEAQQYAGLMLLVQDLSQIRQLEDQLERVERDAVIGRMAAGVAHELRNPLSSIKGLVLLLKSRLKDDDQAEQTAELMIDQVERLNRSISELLDYARPAISNRTKFAVDDLIAKAVMLVRSDADSGAISIVENYRCGEYRAEGDQDKITQVILNICLNAIQAMEHGGKLDISTSCSARGVEVVISDNGCGIASDIREKVFEPYFTTKHDGTGLGLALSARIIADHNGSISITSTENSGTRVVLRLPASQ